MFNTGGTPTFAHSLLPMHRDALEKVLDRRVQLANEGQRIRNQISAVATSLPLLRGLEGRWLRSHAGHADDFVSAMPQREHGTCRLIRRSRVFHGIKEHAGFFWKVGRNLVTICVANLCPVVAYVFQSQSWLIETLSLADEYACNTSATY